MLLEEGEGEGEDEEIFQSINKVISIIKKAFFETFKIFSVTRKKTILREFLNLKREYRTTTEHNFSIRFFLNT